MAVRVHHPAPVPERRPPAAPVLVGVIRIEDEPASLHFRVPQLRAPSARHLAFVEGQVHVLRSISVLIVYPQGALAVGKTPSRIRVRSAGHPAAPPAARRLPARRCADALFVAVSVGPDLLLAVYSVMGLPHPFDGDVGRNALGQVEAVIRRFERPGTGPFPLVGVADPFADGPQISAASRARTQTTG